MRGWPRIMEIGKWGLGGEGVLVEIGEWGEKIEEAACWSPERHGRLTGHCSLTFSRACTDMASFIHDAVHLAGVRKPAEDTGRSSSRARAQA